MKVEGPGSSSATDSTKKKDKASSGDGSFGSFMTDGAAETSAPVATQSIARVDVLLGVQEVEDPAARAARQRMKVRADSILKELDKLKVSLLTGGLTVGQVVDIADVVASHREKILDPRLTVILDEIDLRAQIEIAKIRKSLDKQASR